MSDVYDEQVLFQVEAFARILRRGHRFPDEQLEAIANAIGAALADVPTRALTREEMRRRVLPVGRIVDVPVFTSTSELVEAIGETARRARRAIEDDG